MFKSKTVIILGAGASCEFGLPSGESLKNTISDYLNIRFRDGINLSSGDRGIADAFRSMDKGLNHLLKVGWQIRAAMPQCKSIDNFLDAHRSNLDIVRVGKIAITKAILDAEVGSKLRSDSVLQDGPEPSHYRNTWINQLAMLLTERVYREEIDTLFDNVSFVVFNYDRCLEHVLTAVVKNYYLTGTEQARSIVRKVDIYHPYGMVGHLPWLSSHNAIEFGQTAGAAVLSGISGGIKTFTEQDHEKNLLDNIRSLLVEAEKVVFLGFAFHEANMELLRVPSNSNVREVYATVLGLSPSDVQIAREHVGKTFNKSFDSDKIIMASDHCNSFLQSFGSAISR